MPTAPPLTYELFAGEVREFMRDFPQLNRLISGEETTDRMLMYCTMLAIDEFNTTPPRFGTVGISDFPSRMILLYLTLIHVLTSASLLHARNRFSYNDGGYSVETEQQEALYQQRIQLMRSQIAPQIQSLKVAMNIEGAYGGGIGSEYGYINAWYGQV